MKSRYADNVEIKAAGPGTVVWLPTEKIVREIPTLSVSPQQCKLPGSCRNALLARGPLTKGRRCQKGNFRVLQRRTLNLEKKKIDPKIYIFHSFGRFLAAGTLPRHPDFGD
jgi:hypothetical protein